MIEDETKAGGSDGRVTIGMIAFTPSTGDVIWDEFDGTFPSLSYSRWLFITNVKRRSHEARLGGELIRNGFEVDLSL